MERTFIIIKPDAVQRGLVGEIIGRFERRGLKLSAMKFLQVDDALARQHYDVHAERPFFGGLIADRLIGQFLRSVTLSMTRCGPTNRAMRSVRLKVRCSLTMPRDTDSACIGSVGLNSLKIGRASCRERV